MSEFLPLATSFFPDPSTETGLYILISLLYLAGALGFILSLKWMSDAKTARKGIFAGEIGFVLAIIGTLLLPVITTTGYIYIAVAMLIGAARHLAATRGFSWRSRSGGCNAAVVAR